MPPLALALYLELHRPVLVSSRTAAKWRRASETRSQSSSGGGSSSSEASLTSLSPPPSRQILHARVKVLDDSLFSPPERRRRWVQGVDGTEKQVEGEPVVESPVSSARGPTSWLIESPPPPPSSLSSGSISYKIAEEATSDRHGPEHGDVRAGKFVKETGDANGDRERASQVMLLDPAPSSPILVTATPPRPPTPPVDMSIERPTASSPPPPAVASRVEYHDPILPRRRRAPPPPASIPQRRPPPPKKRERSSPLSSLSSLSDSGEEGAAANEAAAARGRQVVPGGRGRRGGRGRGRGGKGGTRGRSGASTKVFVKAEAIKCDLGEEVGMRGGTKMDEEDRDGNSSHGQVDRARRPFTPCPSTPPSSAVEIAPSRLMSTPTSAQTISSLHRPPARDLPVRESTESETETALGPRARQLLSSIADELSSDAGEEGSESVWVGRRRGAQRKVPEGVWF